MFRTKKLAIQFLPYDTTVKGLLDDLIYGKIDDGERKHDLPPDVGTMTDQDDTQPPKQQADAAPRDAGHADMRFLVFKINDYIKLFAPSTQFFAGNVFLSASDTTSFDHALTSSLASS